MSGAPRRLLVHWLALSALVLGGLWFALFREAFDPDRRLAFRDVSHFYLPLYEYLRQRVWEDGLPLWNPLWNTGVPIVGDATSALFYPPRLLFLLPASTASLMLVYVLAHLALAAGGAAFATRRQGGGGAACLLAAVLYSGAGPIVFQYTNPVFLVGAAWLPWSLAWLVEVARAPSRRGIACAAAALALPILGGDAQAPFHALILVGLWWAWRALGGLRSSARGPRGPTGELDGPSPQPRLVPMAVSAALAGLAALVQIWPAAALSAQSERVEAAPPGVSRLLRDGDGGAEAWWLAPDKDTHAARIYEFSTPPYSLAEMLVPNLFASEWPRPQRLSRLFDAREQAWTVSFYAGAIAALLALLSLSRREPGFWLGAGAFAWLASLGVYGGGYAYDLLCRALGTAGNPDLDPALGGPYWWLVALVPGYGSFRFPGKWSVIVALGLAVHAACWMERSASGAGRDLARLKRLAFAAAASGAVAALLLHLARASGWRPDWIEGALAAGRGNSPFWGAFDLSGALRHVTLSFWHLAAVALVLALLVSLRLRAGADRRGRFVLLVTLATAADLAFASWHGRWVITAPRALDTAEEGEREPLARQLAPEQRQLQIDDWQWFDTGAAAPGGDVRLAEVELAERRSLSGAHNLVAGVPLLNGSPTINAALFSSLWERVIPAVLYSSPDEQAQRVPALLHWLSVDRIWHRAAPQPLAVDGVTYVAPSFVTTSVGPGRPTVRASTHWRVTAEDPRAAFERAAQEAAAGAGLGPEWVWSDDEPVPEPTAAEPASVPVIVRAQGSQWLSAELIAEVRTLVTFQVFQDGNWRATIEPTDGASVLPREVEPWAANGIGQGVVVEPGSWRITLRYRPAWLPVGGAISLAAWLALGVLVLRRPGSIRRRGQSSLASFSPASFSPGSPP